MASRDDRRVNRPAPFDDDPDLHADSSNGTSGKWLIFRAYLRRTLSGADRRAHTGCDDGDMALTEHDLPYPAAQQCYRRVFDVCRSVPVGGAMGFGARESYTVVLSLQPAWAGGYRYRRGAGIDRYAARYAGCEGVLLAESEKELGAASLS